eukprot:TRINITY_DN48649_c0_g1_i1.p1 TRINITY_DN48649_c0_g1~~TRINITY_DN48649_c0_g1_i1.p1  ORF type:complete len:280 (+),score=42.53 TRINITY_DN48649_c0_g1_i1:250-1089(+)
MKKGVKASKHADKSSSEERTVRKHFAQWELAPDEFTISVHLSGKDILGLDVDWGDGKTLYIKGVKSGVVKDWNRDHPSEVVRGGDRVIGVNGIADDPDAMLAECRNRGHLTLLIRGQEDRTSLKAKPRDEPPMVSQDVGPELSAGANESLITLDTSGQPLGIEVDWVSGCALYIRSMQSGALEDWNTAHDPERAVLPGDTIVAVNGFAGDAAVMIRHCQNNRRMQLLVRRPPPPPSTPVPTMRGRASPSPGTKESKENSCRQKDKGNGGGDKKRRRGDE